MCWGQVCVESFQFSVGIFVLGEEVANTIENGASGQLVFREIFRKNSARIILESHCLESHWLGAFLHCFVFLFLCQKNNRIRPRGFTSFSLKNAAKQSSSFQCSIFFQYLWLYKSNLTKDMRFDSAASEVCKDDLQKVCLEQRNYSYFYGTRRVFSSASFSFFARPHEWLWSQLTPVSIPFALLESNDQFP